MLAPRPVRVLDLDTRFADVPGFLEWDLYRPRNASVSELLSHSSTPMFCASTTARASGAGPIPWFTWAPWSHRAKSVDEIVGAALYFASDASSYTTGITLNGGGITLTNHLYNVAAKDGTARADARGR